MKGESPMIAPLSGLRSGPPAGCSTLAEEKANIITRAATELEDVFAQ